MEEENASVKLTIAFKHITVGGLKFNEGLNLFEIILKNDLFCNTFYSQINAKKNEKFKQI